ncbi:MAG: ATP-binding cassette domain-containing protein [Candidatus Heimdallarchaeota archaeon]|nr:ATP-binding cassette domain-containing protein [Candidatus Heimdallarchaeota archaeon]MCG3256885.1 ATP-binding cassette domain-containing protein [Candidatus Heimdallarchaeota archaeon]MCK4611949.1 ATP-binding cassette domain-containing protein [Candidatus Heimdallarchaeota archaeon]
MIAFVAAIVVFAFEQVIGLIIIGAIVVLYFALPYVPPFNKRPRVAHLKAVDGISLQIRKGKIVGLVGESGCGKSTAAKTIIRLHEPTEGAVYFKGIDINRLTSDEMKEIRRHLQIVFQDPYASLNPRATAHDIIIEPFDIHGVASGDEASYRVLTLLKDVGLAPHHAYRYPHEFSGGQRQRLGIARALALEPDFIVMDEPVSNLDVSVRAAIIQLILHLQKKMGLTYLFIAHDLSLVKILCDEVNVMYLGKIMEAGTSDEIFESMMHPYTKALISAVPIADPTKRSKKIFLTGDIPTPINPPPGCKFQTRCPLVSDICRVDDPPAKWYTASHVAFCHNIEGGEDSPDSFTQ